MAIGTNVRQHVSQIRNDLINENWILIGRNVLHIAVNVLWACLIRKAIWFCINLNIEINNQIVI